MEAKSLLVALLFLPFCLSAQSKRNSESVHSYSKKNGTKVESYHRSKANGTEKDNYSAKGNVNPYTGKKGYKASKK
jgi:hypothetical protein